MLLPGGFALSAKGTPIPFFGWELPALVGPDQERARRLEEIQETMGAIGYALFGIHAAIALLHPYAMRNNTLVQIQLRAERWARKPASSALLEGRARPDAPSAAIRQGVPTMNTPRHRLTPFVRNFALPLALALAAVPALAGDDCDVPIDQWQPREAVMQKAERLGWNVQRLKIDDGCYELRGRDENGRAFKAKLDPRTLQPVKMKLRERDDHERERTRQRGGAAVAPKAAGSASDAASAAPVSGAPVTPGTTPRATIE